MDGIHDLGGKQGHGKIDRSGEDKVFKTDWEGRIFGIVLGTTPAPGWNIDRGRHARECIDPGDYLTRGYFDRWLVALETLLIDSGRASLEEILAGKAESRPNDLPAPHGPDRVWPIMQAGYDPKQEERVPPRHAVGAKVRFLGRGVPGHTRLPAYVMGVAGSVVGYYGNHTLPDAYAHGEHRAEPLYCVKVLAGDCFPERRGSKDSIFLDAWESYLEPAE